MFGQDGDPLARPAAVEAGTEQRAGGEIEGAEGRRLEMGLQLFLAPAGGILLEELRRQGTMHPLPRLAADGVERGA